MTEVSIVIVSYNTKAYLQEALESIYAHCNNVPEVIVVDNASDDGSQDMVRQQYPQVMLIESEQNLGFGVGNNLGVSRANGDYVLLFNSDAYMTMDTADILKTYMDAHKNVSCVCPKVLLPESRVVQPKTFGFSPTAKRIFMQSLGLNRLFPKSEFFRGTDGDYRWAREMEVGWISGVCMMIRKQDYLAVGGFDSRFFMYCEDVELCMKLAQLGKVMLLNDADIVHYGGASSKSIQAKVRNSVWQQRHLLVIVKEYYGALQAVIARLIMLVGMSLRLIISILRVPVNGIHNNASLLSAWARLKDLLNPGITSKVGP